MPLRPVVDERGFEAGLDPGDLRLVQVCLALAARCNLDVEVVEELSVHHRDPALLGLGRVDQHSFHGFDPIACHIRLRDRSKGGTEIARRHRPRKPGRHCSHRPLGTARIGRRACTRLRFAASFDTLGALPSRALDRSRISSRRLMRRRDELPDVPDRRRLRYIKALHRHGARTPRPEASVARSISTRGSICLDSEPLGCVVSSSSISAPLRLRLPASRPMIRLSGRLLLA